MAEAGYAKSFDTPFYYMAGRVAGTKETTEAAPLYPNAAGIRAKVEGIEAPLMLEEIRNTKKDPNAQLAAMSPTGPSHYPDPTITLVIQIISASSMSIYSNAEFDALVDQSLATLDNRKRGELLKKALRILCDDVAHILIWCNISVFVTKKILNTHRH